MNIIRLSGPPASGKTAKARRIIAREEAAGRSVVRYLVDGQGNVDLMHATRDGDVDTLIVEGIEKSAVDRLADEFARGWRP